MGAEAPASPTPAPSGCESGRCVFEPIRTSLSKGAQEARSAAERAVPKVKQAAADTAYWLGYGASFAATFCFIVAKELTPKVVAQGCREGAQAGRSSGERFAASLQRPLPTPNPPAAPVLDLGLTAGPA